MECLTPHKLSNFYRLVGGDYDRLFLDTPSHSLSFIYRSLGCFHTLQPGRDPHAAPSTPALTCAGFVRWQTVQLLLDPDEHVPFLQKAVKRFDLINAADGEAFPALLNRDALPLKSDPHMVAWYAAVSERLLQEVQASQDRSLPQRPPMPALSDVDTEHSRPTSADSLSIETQSLADAANFFQQPQKSTYDPRRSQSNVVNPVGPGVERRDSFGKIYDRHGTSIPRRSSFPQPQPSAQSTSRHRYSSQHPPSPSRTKLHARTPSTSSTSCSSDCSSMTSSVDSLDHAPRQFHHSPQSRSTVLAGQGIPLQRTSSHPNIPPPWHDSRATSRRLHSKGDLPGLGRPDRRSNSTHLPPIPPVNLTKNPTNRGYQFEAKPGLSRAKTVGANPLRGNHATHELGMRKYRDRKESGHWR